MGRAHQLPATKTCYCCKQEKGLTDFHAKKSSRDERSGECKECKRESARNYREANPEKVAEQKRRWHASNPRKARGKRLKRYGLTIEQHDEIQKRQGGGCAICGIELGSKTSNTTPHVDHCHKTGIVRGHSAEITIQRRGWSELLSTLVLWSGTWRRTPCSMAHSPERKDKKIATCCTKWRSIELGC